MNIEQALKILHPDTTREALADIDYCGRVDACNEACLTVCEEIKRLQKENESLNIRVKIYQNTKDSCKLFPNYNCALYHEYAVLESKLNKAITLLQLIKEYIPHQCSTCAHWGDGIKMRCNAGGCLNPYKPDRWEWIYKAELQELIGGSENE